MLKARLVGDVVSKQLTATTDCFAYLAYHLNLRAVYNQRLQIAQPVNETVIKSRRRRDVFDRRNEVSDLDAGGLNSAIFHITLGEQSLSVS